MDVSNNPTGSMKSTARHPPTQHQPAAVSTTVQAKLMKLATGENPHRSLDALQEKIANFDKFCSFKSS